MGAIMLQLRQSIVLEEASSNGKNGRCYNAWRMASRFESLRIRGSI
jgi:hypothetical protein